MSKHQSFQGFKEFLNTAFGRFSALVVIAILLILLAVLPGVLSHGVTDKERDLAAGIIDLAKANDKVIAGSATAQVGGINANIGIDIATKTIDEGQGKLDIKATIGTNTFNIPAEFVYNQTKKEQYYKLSNLDKLLDVALNPEAVISTKIKSVADKIDGNWLRLSSDNVKGIADNTDAANLDECTPQLFGNITTDKSAQESIAKLIASDTLFNVKSVNKVESGHKYSITVNSDKAEQAMKELKKTELFKNSDKCDDSYNPFKSQEEANATQATPKATTAKPVVTFDITVNDKQQITVLDYSSKSQTQVLSLNVDINSDKKVAVAVPQTDVVDYSAISGQVTSILNVLTTAQQNAQNPANNLVQPYAR